MCFVKVPQEHGEQNPAREDDKMEDEDRFRHVTLRSKKRKQLFLEREVIEQEVSLGN